MTAQARTAQVRRRQMLRQSCGKSTLLSVKLGPLTKQNPYPIYPSLKLTNAGKHP